MKKIDEAELKELVDEVIRVTRKYYSTHGDKDLIPKLHESEKKLGSVSDKALAVASHADFAIRSRAYLTNKQYYHIIDYLCGTNLEEKGETYA